MVHPANLLTTPNYRAKLNQCIHCGMCLEACPTYAVFGTEMDGPRGRIALMRAASDGRIDLANPNGTFARHLNRCLACRACETACPSGVQYGTLIETARSVIEQHRQPGSAERFLNWVGLQQLMPYSGRLRFITRTLQFYQKLGLQGLVRKLNFLPPTLAALENLLPPLTPQFRASDVPARAEGEIRGRVAFFTGCVQDAFLSQVNSATVRVLQRNGYEVHFFKSQTCCGAAHTHSGAEEFARDLARQNIDTFSTNNFDAIINNAGGCGLMLKEYSRLLEDDPHYAERASLFSAKVVDINEFLADHLHAPPQGRLNIRVTYADSCHLRHGQKVVQQPRLLLRQIPGLELVELKQPDRCCGSAGIYNIAQPETAAVILHEKMMDIVDTGAEVVATSNTGCHLQLISGVRQTGLPATVMHVVEILELSYRAEA